jgi:hypothetical protein
VELRPHDPWLVAGSTHQPVAASGWGVSSAVDPSYSPLRSLDALALNTSSQPRPDGTSARNRAQCPAVDPLGPRRRVHRWHPLRPACVGAARLPPQRTPSYARRLAPHASLADQVEDARDAPLVSGPPAVLPRGRRSMLTRTPLVASRQARCPAQRLLAAPACRRRRVRISDFADPYYEPRITGCGTTRVSCLASSASTRSRRPSRTATSPCVA